MQKPHSSRKAIEITVYDVRQRREEKAAAAGRRHPPYIIGDSPYDRKAELLIYSHQLRSSACRQQQQHRVTEALQFTSVQSFNHQIFPCHNSLDKVSPIVSWKAEPMEDKLQRAQPSCFGDWRKIFPSCMMPRNSCAQAFSTA